MTVPKGHEEIGLKELSQLSIKDGALYWKGEKIKTDAEVRLSRGQKLVAGALSFFVAVASITAPAFSYFADRDSICRNSGYSGWLLCPPESKPDVPSETAVGVTTTRGSDVQKTHEAPSSP
jgi:hypothetical protein